MPRESAQEAGRVSLLVTCLADQFFPEVAEAAVRAIRRLGVRVDCPSGQTCCGLPHYNNGFRDEARRLAERNIELFGEDGPVVIPSGSCGWMCKSVYPSLFEGDPWTRARAIRFSGRVIELSAFLASRPEGTKREGGGDAPQSGKGFGKIAVHDSCHALRGLGLRDAPRKLLAETGAEVVDLPGADRCCGFGGSFAVKFDEVSTAILKEKLQAARECGADTIVTADGGCLMQLRVGAGKWVEMGLDGPPPRCLHLAEVLAPPEDAAPPPPPASPPPPPPPQAGANVPREGEDHAP
ncbi:MAG: (Fe-S)-binding protein [Nitrospinota bacterium]|jgi:L-lactate dehydrogenase complex protein LldE|nr:(Fe-S)-binding protein [Nitrospinota bacterium]